MAGTSRDPLNLAELDPQAIQERIDEKSKKTPSQLELQKEARLAEKEKRLTSGGTSKMKAPSEAPSTAPPPPPVVINRSLMLDKIMAYRERFPHLKKRNTISAKSSDDEIADELHYCELQLGSQGGGTNNIAGTVLYGAMIGVEKVTREYWNPLGLDLTGLGAVAQQNMDQFQPLLDELMIKYNAGTYTSPEWRLALALGATIMTVNAANNNPDMARAVKSMNQAVNPVKNGQDL